MTFARRILVLYAHPAAHRSRANRHLTDALRELDGVTLHDLYEEYPDLHINVAREQQLLREHEAIIFQHPFYWYSSPAILKEWQDLVLEWGFAYGENGTALRGKLLLSAITTGGTAEAYGRTGGNYFAIRELLAPFEQTARLCGMEYLPPWVLHATHRLTREELVERGERYSRTVIALRDDTLDWSAVRAAPYLQTVGHGLE